MEAVNTQSSLRKADIISGAASMLICYLLFHIFFCVPSIITICIHLAFPRQLIIRVYMHSGSLIGNFCPITPISGTDIDRESGVHGANS
ncbi:hypothetical protein BHC48_01450 [Snodgrassella communis]|uniref:Uncharacterized protein n=1 Tax=Snodgrassella alvi TaxID=1196083 RepID=A0A2N9XTS3_9NEIS|nr:hypothetical protein BHC48_01450 [Snodgrassella communis]